MPVIVVDHRYAPARLPSWASGCALLSAVSDPVRVLARARWRGSACNEENLLAGAVAPGGRNRRRYGGYIIHLGVVLMALGIIGIEIFQTRRRARSRRASRSRWAITPCATTRWRTSTTPDGRNVARAVVSVFKDGQSSASCTRAGTYYYESQQPMTIPGVRSTLEDDLYVLLVDWQPIASQGATFKVYHNPLVNWLWLGGLVFILGTLVAAWPDPRAGGLCASRRQRRAPGWLASVGRARIRHDHPDA